MSHWYLCQTKCRDENRAKVNLERQGYKVTLPTLNADPLFPGYLFVLVDEKPFAPIDSTKGVIRLVRFGNQLAIVPQQVIDDLEKTEWVRSEECSPGSEVIVNTGAFSHMRAIVKAKKADRIVVLMKILNRPQELTFSLADVEAV